MDWVQWVTIATAGIGAALGILNTVWSWHRDRVRLKVAAMWQTFNASVAGTGKHISVVTEYANGLKKTGNGLLGIRVTNFSFFEVTIDSVGLSPSNWLVRRFQRWRILQPLTSDQFKQVELPYRLKPRESIIVWCGLQGGELDAKLLKARCVYANTACGLDIYGRSGLFKRLIARARDRS